MNVFGPILIVLLLAAGVFAAIRFRHKLITRILTVIAGLGIAWAAVYLIALSSVKCLGSCG
ncbi:MAG: hypothetical protein ACN6QT_18585 [Burkholderia contaminans]|uniref:Uncharacterized protein n=1 Tax=Burkholderia contaminans TaxID=488447 RepID=A0AAP4R102_9BURK|nr:MULTISPECIES: hypothetical protein [Burkholderia]MBD1414263.1 hypothetical protein [Burkholderia contaminans]MBH9666966.1 hypothetical protein [Burkholderia contaminans]MBH9673487.1 hypothetical protein [Burkholderia contaminans]MBH9703530.1 hypothetical protein [Burkholderia contaminans]MBH9720012.1 hypothetical protein [Burkholderia contaminans]